MMLGMVIGTLAGAVVSMLLSLVLPPALCFPVGMICGAVGAMVGGDFGETISLRREYDRNRRLNRR